MKTKIWYESKEMWVVVLYLLNFILGYFELPAFSPTPEFNAAVLTVIGVLRMWFTEAKLTLKKND